MKYITTYFNKKSLTDKENFVWKLMILPTIITLFLVTIFPTIFTLYNSLFKWNFSHPQYGRTFIGLGNYIKAATDTLFLKSLLHTIEIVLIAVSVEFVLGFAIALLFNMKIKGLKFIRTLIIMPTMITPVVAALMWLLMYNSEFGVIRFLVEGIGIKPVPIWLADKNFALLAVTLVDIWQWTPFVLLILLAGLTNIPKEMIEASHIDGANPFQRFIFIELPNLKPLKENLMLFLLADC